MPAPVVADGDPETIAERVEESSRGSRRRVHASPGASLARRTSSLRTSLAGASA